MGETSWLDGFDGFNDSGVFFAASLRDHSIYLLKWKAAPIKETPTGSSLLTLPSGNVSEMSSSTSSPMYDDEEDEYVTLREVRGPLGTVPRPTGQNEANPKPPVSPRTVSMVLNNSPGIGSASSGDSATV